jgi:HTH-type transcriptional regulator/antitoxin HigA
MGSIRPAEAFHPGEYLREELEERGWIQSDLATITDVQPAILSGVINGKRSINVPLAIALGKALGTSPDLWVNLQFQYDRWDALTDRNDDVERRAKLYEFPVREMSKRGWVDDRATLEVLEHQMSGYFDSFAIAAKRSKNNKRLTSSQKAWLHRTKQLAECLVDTPPYSLKALETAIESFRQFLHAPEETSKVSSILKGAGVRFVVVEGLPGLKLDGVCYWMDQKSPVVALSMRSDRIDNFWFVLRHELEHVLRADAKGVGLAAAVPDSMETTLNEDSGETASRERVANSAASDFCVPKKHMDGFIDRWSGYYQKKRIDLFANSIGVHPGLVVGQLHGKGELHHKNLRKSLARVRDNVTMTTLTDGWGIAPQLN